MIHVDSSGSEKAHRKMETEDKRTVIHLKENLSSPSCAKCNASISDDVVYTHNKEVYNNPPPGYRNCRAMWTE
jgi:hypothetical protein